MPRTWRGPAPSSRARRARADATRAMVYDRRVRVLRLAVALVLSTGCGFGTRTVPVDAGVTFAAHLEHAGIVFDRLPGVGHAIAKPRSGFRTPGAPAFFLVRDGKSGA